MADAIGIGFFQVDNLVRNRVPMCLLSICANFESLYGGLELDHILRYSQSILDPENTKEVLRLLQERRVRSTDPILVVCSDGKRSQMLASLLGSHDFANCYYVVGGFEQLLVSAREEGSL